VSESVGERVRRGGARKLRKSASTGDAAAPPRPPTRLFPFSLPDLTHRKVASRGVPFVPASRGVSFAPSRPGRRRQHLRARPCHPAPTAWAGRPLVLGRPGACVPRPPPPPAAGEPHARAGRSVAQGKQEGAGRRAARRLGAQGGGGGGSVSCRAGTRAHARCSWPPIFLSFLHPHHPRPTQHTPASAASRRAARCFE